MRTVPPEGERQTYEAFLKGYLDQGFIHNVRSNRLERIGQQDGPALLEVYRWLRENVGEMGSAWVYFSVDQFLFKTADDAFHFKMRWV